MRASEFFFFFFFLEFFFLLRILDMEKWSERQKKFLFFTRADKSYLNPTQETFWLICGGKGNKGLRKKKILKFWKNEASEIRR